MQELDTQELDLADEEGAPGRHRAPTSAPRRVLLHLTLAALGVLLATGLGTLAADWVGLSDLGLSSQDASLPAPENRDEPRPQRAADVPTGEQLPAPESAAPSPEPQPEAAGTAEAPAPEPAAETPSPAPVVTVRTGDSCAAVGQTAVTTRGDTAVCTASPGHGPNKWRVA